MNSDSYDNEGYVPREVNYVDILQSEPEKQDGRRLCDTGYFKGAWGELARRLLRYNDKGVYTR